MPKKNRAERQADSERLENAVTDFILSQNEDFDVDAAMYDIAESLDLDRFEEDKFFSLLTQNSDVFFDGEEVVIPRHVFFKDASLKVKLTPFEYEHKILFPGHRFIPYLSNNVFPSEASIQDESGNQIPQKRYTCNTEDAIIYHTLLGKMDMFLFFTMEQEKYHADIDDIFGKGTCNFTVFDMSEYFAKHDYKQNDSLIVTLEDWQKGVFSIKHEAASGVIDFAGTTKWCSDMKAALLHVFEEQTGLIPITEQIAQAYFKGPETLRTNPVIHFGGFLNQCKEIEFATSQKTSLLWLAGEDPGPELMERMMSEGLENMYSDEMDTLEAALKSVGIALGENEVELYMKDALADGAKDWKPVFNRMVAGRPNELFMDDDQEEEFGKLMAEVWEEVSEYYDPKLDALERPIRAGLTALSDAQLEFFRTLDTRGAQPMDMPQDLMAELAGIWQHLGILQQALCGPPSTVLSKDFFMESEEMIDILGGRCKELMDEVIEKTPLFTSPPGF
ncbi:hypothetical protein BVY04_05455 [bacterium M21]|nr:hypothetical protein BVY04_05455 [bacterium M21]